MNMATPIGQPTGKRVAPAHRPPDRGQQGDADRSDLDERVLTTQTPNQVCVNTGRSA